MVSRQGQHRHKHSLKPHGCNKLYLTKLLLKHDDAVRSIYNTQNSISIFKSCISCIEVHLELQLLLRLRRSRCNHAGSMARLLRAGCRDGRRPSLQATSQRRFLPALTPGNMKITATITLITRHPSVAEGQRLLALPTACD